MPQLQVTIDPELDEIIQREADKLRQTRSSYARLLLLQALDKLNIPIQPINPKPIKELEVN